MTVVASLPCYRRENVDAQRGKRRLRAQHRGAAAAQRARLRHARHGARRSTSSTTRSAPSCRRRRPSSRRDYQRELRERLRHRVRPPLHDHQHADQALRRLRCERDGRHAEAYMDLLVTTSTRRRVPALMCRSPGVGRLGRRALRLRLQPDARAAARRRRARRAASGISTRSTSSRRRRSPPPPLLRLHGGRRLELLRRPDLDCAPRSGRCVSLATCWWRPTTGRRQS